MRLSPWTLCHTEAAVISPGSLTQRDPSLRVGMPIGRPQ